MYWIGSTVVLNLGRSFLHPISARMNISIAISFSWVWLPLRPIRCANCANFFSTHHDGCFAFARCEGADDEIQTLGRLRSPWCLGGAPGLASRRRGVTKPVVSVLITKLVRYSKLLVSEEFAICGMFIQVGHAKMQRDELGQIRVGSLYDHSCGISFGKWCLNLYSVEAPMKSMKDMTVVIGTLWDCWWEWSLFFRYSFVRHQLGDKLERPSGDRQFITCFFPFKQLQWLAQADDTSGFASALRIAPPLRHRGAMSQSTGHRPIIFLRIY